MNARTITAVLAATALGLAGCSSGGDGGGDLPAFTPGGSTSATAAPSGTATGAPSAAARVVDGVAVGSRRPGQAEAAAVYDAYLTYWGRSVAALRDPAAADAALELTVDPQRARSSSQFQGLRAKRQHAVGDLRIRPSGIRVNGDVAALRDCLDDSAMSLVDAAGTAVPDSAGTAQVIAVAMVRIPGGWLVKDVKTRPGSC